MLCLSNGACRGDAGQPLRCEWDGCYVEFGRRAELKRHVDTLHISPSSHKCPKPGCKKSCSRRDNLKVHVRRVHGQNI
ncbi:uncharacterized protein BDW47DRAFT_104462 [Aspergillus candidus]|uniref:C2H2-type domain-containing protein n=1 Tax=Aspergillus candidus TaxID=41067 RepID=A0A2I2FE20_ASPCN|nr:hypothetical protein BDW47DRAFT_104462 [Aspergillus candidus]PLB38880.1 hypothetical protein BDW47DRAFT_104462 [Aspergillus candidus]